MEKTEQEIYEELMEVCNDLLKMCDELEVYLALITEMQRRKE